LRWFHQASGRSAGRDLLTLMTYDPGVKPKVPSDLPPARVFPAVGLASMHTALGEKDKDIALLFRSSPFGSVSHGHADQNAFTVDAFGRGLALATGFYPWYSSPHHHQWTRDTRAVCSVLVDGKGQVVRSWKARGRIVAFKNTKGYDYVAGEAAEAYGGRLKRFRRQIVHVRGGVFVIYDDLVASKPSTFQWLLHAHDQIGVEGRVLRVRRDPAAMDVHMLLPQQSTVSQHDKYTPEPESHKHKRRNYEKTWHLSVSTKRPELSERFLNVLVVRRKGDEHPVSKVNLVRTKSELGVHMVRHDGKFDTVLFRTGQGGDNPVRVLLGALREK
ncbi:MAG: heparinase II/III family protein, partial [Phycisphaerae bacterium]|nr:heparinase II/III family protein [Phycisphaerae bacterium]